MEAVFLLVGKCLLQMARRKAEFGAEMPYHALCLAFQPYSLIVQVKVQLWLQLSGIAAEVLVDSSKS